MRKKLLGKKWRAVIVILSLCVFLILTADLSVFAGDAIQQIEETGEDNKEGTEKNDENEAGEKASEKAGEEAGEKTDETIGEKAGETIEETGEDTEENKNKAEEKADETIGEKVDENHETTSDTAVTPDGEKNYKVSFNGVKDCILLINGEEKEITAKCGDKITLTVNIDNGKHICLIAGIDDTDSLIELEKISDHEFQFIMPDRPVYVSAAAKNNAAMMFRAAYAVGDTYTVTTSEKRYPETNPNGTQIVGEYLEFNNSITAFCTEHLLTAPAVGTVYTIIDVYTAKNQKNETYRKVLYYGWHGPADQGIGYQTTHLGLSVAKGYPDSAWKVGQAYLNRIAPLPAAPEGFNVYIMSSGRDGIQQVAFWEYNPIQYIRIKKNFEGGMSGYNPDSSPAVYGLYTDAACTVPYITPYIPGNQGQFRIEADGMTGVIPVEPGIYYAKEVRAPSGYKLDASVYKLDTSGKSYIDSGRPLTVTSTDKINYAKAKVVKTSGNTDMTNGNSCYSLSGAVYGIYASKSDAQNGINVIAKLTTGTDGQSQTVELIPKTYYFKEITAPKGYKLETAIISKTLAAGQTATISFKNQPLGTQAVIEIFKYSKDGSSIIPAPLSGALFTVNYYSGYYTQDTLPQKPTRTWVIETKKEVNNGKTQYAARLGETYKVSGNNFYYQSGIITLPLGTITVEETKAPVGYLLDGGYLKSETSGKTVSGIYTAQIKSDKESVTLEGGNRFSVYDVPVRGGISIQKIDIETEDGGAQGSASLSGAVYAVENLNDYEVLVNGKNYKKGEVVLLLETDQKGRAQTGNDILPYGKYKVYETTASCGYLINNTAREFEIKDHHKIVVLDGDMPEQVIRGGVKIQKRDFETKLDTAADFSTFKGMQAAIISLNNAPVIVNGSVYHSGEKVMTLILDESGSAVTNKDALPYGHYKIVETKAPAGYLLEGDIEREFMITGESMIVDMTSEENAILDKPDYGSITIIKKDGQNHALEGVSFLLERLDDETNSWVEAANLSTDVQGKLVFEKLHFGKYRISETKTVPGLSLLSEPVEVTVPFSAQAEDDQRENPSYTIDGVNYYKDVALNISNDAVQKLPDTGGGGMAKIPYIVAAYFAAVFGMILFLNERKYVKRG